MTGEVILASKKPPDALDRLFQFIEEAEVPEAFMAGRDNAPGKFRNIFYVET